MAAGPVEKEDVLVVGELHPDGGGDLLHLQAHLLGVPVAAPVDAVGEEVEAVVQVVCRAARVGGVVLVEVRGLPAERQLDVVVLGGVELQPARGDRAEARDHDPRAVALRVDPAHVLQHPRGLLVAIALIDDLVLLPNHHREVALGVLCRVLREIRAVHLVQTDVIIMVDVKIINAERREETGGEREEKRQVSGFSMVGGFSSVCVF